MAEQNTVADRAIAMAREIVVESTGYRSQFSDTQHPKASRFVRTLEGQLQKGGATLLETCDPGRTVEQRRMVPRGDWPYSIWRCPDKSIAAVFEGRGEAANNEGDLMRYAQAGKQASPSPNPSQIRYAGAWDGEKAQDLSMALHRAVARIKGGEDVEMGSAIMFTMIDVPYADRIADDHPLHKLGILHGIDSRGHAVISSEESGALFVMPTDLAGMAEERRKAVTAAAQSARSPLGAAFHSHHKRIVSFYDRAIQATEQAQTHDEKQDQKQAPSMSMG